MPSASVSDFVYAALFYHGTSPKEEKFEPGTIKTDEDGSTRLAFSFQRPDETDGFTLEIFAFKAGTAAADFSTGNAVLSGKESGLSVTGETIAVENPIALSSNKPGSVRLKITVPAGCSLTISDTRFAVAQDSGESDSTTYIVSASGISAGAYPVTFTLTKGGQVVYTFAENINVINGLCTDTWWNGATSSATKEITQGVISNTVYVRGKDAPWYTTNAPSATASDNNSGSYLSPFATIQKAVDAIIARNDGSSPYTIYVDGTFTTSSAALADFNDPSQTQKLSVKIAGFSASEKAVLDGNNTARGIVVGSDSAQKDVNLTLENLIVQNTKYSGGRGGGITLCCKAGNSHLIKNCDIKNNNASYGSAIYNEYGSLDLQGCVISDNTTGTSGTVYNGQASAILTMSDVTIENNSANNGGGVFLANDSTLKISDSSVVIKGNSSSSLSRGKGICVWNGILELSGSAKIDDGVGFPGDSSSTNQKIVVSGALTAESPVATITPSTYAAGKKILEGGVQITQDICKQFALTPDPNGTEWKIVPDGTDKGVLKTTTVYVRGTGATSYPSTAANGSDTNSGDLLHPFATIQKAVDTVIAMNDGASEYTIYVDGTVAQSAAGGGNGMADFSALDKNLTLTIKARSGTATLDAGGNSRVIYAKPTSGALNLTLENLTVTGGQTTGGYPTGNGGGIYFQSSGGNFTMSGGTITGNTATNDGGGVYIASGTFTMGGGTISNNTASHGGGVYISGKFIMNAGEISGNTSDTTGGGVWNDGSFEMNGGTIGNNTGGTAGGGVYLKSPGTFTMSGGEITGNNANMGGGVYVYSGTITMEGGEISNCTVSSKGGGVYIASGGTFNMSGTAKITGCEMTSTSSNTGGGGIYNNGTLAITGGTITGCTSATHGGGVYVYSGTFIMGGGTISGNTAGDNGGGVYVWSATFKISDGTITGNTAGNSKNGVYGTFTQTGGTVQSD